MHVVIAHHTHFSFFLKNPGMIPFKPCKLFLRNVLKQRTILLHIILLNYLKRGIN